MLIKMEAVPGHHDSIMYGVAPDRSKIGPREHPSPYPRRWA